MDSRNKNEMELRRAHLKPYDELEKLDVLDVLEYYAAICAAGHDHGCGDADEVLKRYIIKRFESLNNLLDEIDYETGEQFGT